MIGIAVKWLAWSVALALTEWLVFQGIAIALSYFEWSPFGYESCGMQAIGWFFIVPGLGIAFLARAAVKYFFRLSRWYLLPPGIAAAIFMFAALSAGGRLPGATAAALLFIALPFFDLWCGWRRRALPAAANRE